MTHRTNAGPAQPGENLLAMCCSQDPGTVLATGCHELATAIGWRRAALFGVGARQKPEGLLATFGPPPQDAAAWADGLRWPEMIALRCFGRLVGYAVGEREGPVIGPAGDERPVGALATTVGLAIAAAGAATPGLGARGSLLGALTVEPATDTGDSPTLTPILTQPHRFQLSAHLPTDAVLVAAGGGMPVPEEHPEGPQPAAAMDTGPLFEALLHLSPGIVVVTEGPEHRILVTNPLAQATYPTWFPVGACLGRILAGLEDDHLTPLDLAFRTGRGSDRVVLGARSRDDGRPSLWSVALRPYHFPDGAVRGLVLVATESASPSDGPVRNTAFGAAQAEASADLVFDSCGTGLLLISLPDLRIVRHNAAVVPLLGGEAARRGTAQGMSATDLLDAATWAELGPALRQLLATGAPTHLGELRTVFSGETEERIYNCALAPVYGPDAGLTHVVASAVEVTDQVRARALLQTRAEAAEQRVDELQQALDGLDAGVALYDTNGEAVWRNSAHVRMFAPGLGDGHALKTELHTPNGQWVPDAARPLFKALAGEAMDNEPYVIHRSDGTNVAVRVSVRPLTGAGGAVVGASVVLRDRAPIQSEIKRMTDLAGLATRRSDALAAVIGSLSDGVMITDAANEALLVNRAFCDLFGLEAVSKTMQGRIAELGARGLDGTPLNLAQTPSGRALAGETVTGVRLLYRHRRGHDLVIEVSASPIRESGGRIAGSVCALRDVTRGQRLMEERDDFISVAAHELRTPLTALLLEIQVLARAGSRGEVPEVWTPHLSRLSASAERLKKLVDGLMDVTRLERGIVTLTTGRHDLARLACAAADRFRLVHPDHPLRARLELVLAEVDPVRLDQLLDNLLDNAAKYCPPGTPIELDLTAEGGKAVLTVADRGKGLPEADLDHVFTRYYRAALHPARRYTGLGLGLFLAREIAHLHGGEIGATNRGGGGLRVTVRLPCAPPR